MRARNLKPGFFTNELLAVSDPQYAIIFAGLWCLADREGRLEDRPAKIHMLINPGRAFEATDRSLTWLAANGFIQRYEVDGIRYIQVIQFLEHQNPHQKEAPSKIPKPDASPVLNGHASTESPVQTPDEPGASTSVARLIPSSLIPDSGSLIPDPGYLNPDPGFLGGMQGGDDAKPRAARSSNATRIPIDFGMTEERKRYASAQGIDPVKTMEDFRDYWIAASGAKARKHDWDATWRMWCRNQAERSQAKIAPRKTRFDEIMGMRNADAK